jgi:FKBP-type peptidyl-prolyl cis-trans isomerase
VKKRRFWIPAELAYGDTPRRPGGPHGMLVFDVELLKINQAPKAPADVAAAPKDAKKTASGLAYKVITKGTGTKHPAASSTVEVHYSGWTTDGKMFDSSVARGEPTSFPLNGVIPGWTEGVQLMVEGEKGALLDSRQAGLWGHADPSGRSCGHAGVRHRATQDSRRSRPLAPAGAPLLADERDLA